MADNGQDHSSKNTIIVLIGSIFIFSLLVGILAYGLGCLWWKAYKKFERARFYLTVMTVAVICLVLGFVFLYTDPLAIREWAFYSLYQGLDHVGLPGHLPEKLARIMIKTFPLGFCVGVLGPMLFSWRKGRFGKNNYSKYPAAMPSQKFAKLRDSTNNFFVGFDEHKKPLFLTQHEMGMHTQVIGSTGFGKTSSFLIPNLNWALSRGAGMVFLDGKGDQESFEQFYCLVKNAGRLNDLKVFSPLFVEVSDKWNPLLRGTPTEVKDRLIGSQIWSEEFYKKKGEDLLLLLLNVFDAIKITPTFKKLSHILEHPDSNLVDINKIQNPEIKSRFLQFRNNAKTEAKNYSGLSSDLSLFSTTQYGHLFECEAGEGIDLLSAYKQNKVVYFHLPVLALEDSAKRIGRVIIHDLKTVVATVQAYMPKNERRFFPVFIDEFASFASENFIELLNKARSAGAAFTLIHQSLGDVQKISDNFAKQLFENTNVKIIMRIDDPETIEKYARMAGTKTSIKYTYQTERHLMGRVLSGGASMREVDEFIVDPNEFRGLGIGGAVIMVKSTRRFYRVLLDYIDPKSDGNFDPLEVLPKKNPALDVPAQPVEPKAEVPKYAADGIIPTRKIQ